MRPALRPEAVAGLVLAGGAGTRFGGPKQLARFRGRPLLEHCLSAMAASPVDPVIVVLGAEHEQVLAEVPLHGVQPLVCQEWNQGLGQSLRTGIEHLPDAEAVVVALGDQPLLSPQSIGRLVAARGRGAVAVRASYRGRAGHPVLLEQELMQRAIELKGDVGASSLLAVDRVREVPCDGLGSDLDVDTPEQLAAIEKSGESAGRGAVSLDRDKLVAACEWLKGDRQVALAVLAEVEGSAPFEPGAMMLVDDEGNIEGSVTGGCVESALADEAKWVMAGGEPSVHKYGISDELAGEVGLMCGGTVHVFVSRVEGKAAEVLRGGLDEAIEGRPVAMATILDGPTAGSRMALRQGERLGTLGCGALFDHTVTRDMEGVLEHGTTSLRRYGADGATMGSDLRVLVEGLAPPPSMVIVGAIDYSVAVAALAQQVGYRVTVVDPRRPFLASRRLDGVAAVAVEWPDRHLNARRLGERDVILVFSHDPKIDEPALLAGLHSGAGYVGAMGSRRTHDERVERLQTAGASENDIARIAAPCGLDIGARTPSETAVSILAEVIATQNARSGKRLTEAHGPIHGH